MEFCGEIKHNLKTEIEGSGKLIDAAEVYFVQIYSGFYFRLSHSKPDKQTFIISNPITFYMERGWGLW